VGRPTEHRGVVSGGHGRAGGAVTRAPSTAGSGGERCVGLDLGLLELHLPADGAPEGGGRDPT
jgi:hypothetical protein